MAMKRPEMMEMMEMMEDSEEGSCLEQEERAEDEDGAKDERKPAQAGTRVYGALVCAWSPGYVYIVCILSR